MNCFNMGVTSLSTFVAQNCTLNCCQTLSMNKTNPEHHKSTAGDIGFSGTI
jgi:hypothetical protein